MVKDLQILPKDKIKVAAKVLHEGGLSLSQVATILGVSDSSVSRWDDLPTPDKLQEFELFLRKQFDTKEKIVAAKALSRMDSKMDTARIGEALEVYKVMMNKGQPNQMTQVNIGAEMGVKFDRDTNANT